MNQVLRSRWTIDRGKFSLQPLGQSEVGDIRLAFGIDQDVRRLEVAVQHAAPMRVGDGSTNGSQQFGGLSRRQRPVGESLCQCGPFDQLHAEVRTAINLTDLIQRDDVRVMELSSRFCLGAKPGQIHRRRQIATQHHLQGDDPVEALLPRLVHDSHATAPEFRQQLIVTTVAGQHARRAIRFCVGRPVRSVLVKQVGEAAEVLGDLNGRPQLAQFSFETGMFGNDLFNRSRLPRASLPDEIIEQRGQDFVAVTHDRGHRFVESRVGPAALRRAGPPNQDRSKSR